MTGTAQIPAGHASFARYAYPPNELGYCGPTDPGVLWRADDTAAITAHATEFDGAWPYLRAIADAVGGTDPLGDDVVRNYWVGGDLLDRVHPGALLHRLRTAFGSQVTGLLSDLSDPSGVLAHHSFHVFVVYPWVRFLDRDQVTPLRVLQNCRIRWGTVESVAGEHVTITSRPLTYTGGALALGAPLAERVRWSRDGASLSAVPAPGDTVTAHWDWVCGTLDAADCRALGLATQTTLDLVNAVHARR
ncbi:DUF6390 family protein [Mycobacterium sp. C31M]